jgi:tRNA1Val (adenine37-N6)-methyltransferase
MNRNQVSIEIDETLDTLFDGRLKIIQKKSGYRFSVDSILLSHFVDVRGRNRIADLGSGSGVISIILACRFPSARIDGVEIQKDLADMAGRSVSLNACGDRVGINHCDVKRVGDFFEAKSMDAVVFNPPYRKIDSGRVNPDRERAVARHEVKGALTDFLAAAKYLLKDSGTVFVIYPARRGVSLFYHMRVHGMEPKKMRMVHSKMSSRAEFILVEGLKGGGEELLVIPPLFIYAENGEYSPEMQELFRNIARPRLFSD